ncbi:uncharacterized protein LOC126746922 isoform X1 [Anthonomus grandis grandis]|uniref:uncharacterized protein LOC126746922 isoform X1 n=1 Tax=Anthonomus grandis grandis TaxID=2921223 RepID=UPI0021652D6C|nr:uncharacterized protein LOC126746922 isoform X1 [Anthonomus grandis grandis]
MMVARTGWFDELIVILIVIFLNGARSVPQPCPQFLPVTVVQSEQPSNIVNLRTQLKVQDGVKEEPDSHGNYFVVSLGDDLPDAADPGRLPINTRSDPFLPGMHEVSSAKPGIKGLTTTKKRRRARPKEAKKLILSQNSLWSLRSINDHPAEEVLMTDKASAARDLKDSTESSIVAVKTLN